jgi:demethoxyubiquinone hydroxylase (CLK1/Coq7/Cat5 family)
VANEHGLLPKAQVAELSDELTHRRDVWFDNLFLTLAQRPEVLRMFLDWTAFIYTDKSSLDPAMVELCRIRLAHRNECVH